MEKQVVREWAQAEDGTWIAQMYLTDDPQEELTQEQYVGMVFGSTNDEGKRRFYSDPEVQVEKPFRQMKAAIKAMVKQITGSEPTEQE